MKFEFNEDNYKILFNENDIKTINKKGCVEFDPLNAKHFINGLSRIVAESHLAIIKKNPELEKVQTFDYTDIKTK